MGLAEIRGHLGFVGVEYGSSRHRLAARSGVRCALGRLVRCAVAPHRKMRDKADLPSPHVVVEKPRGDAQGSGYRLLAINLLLEAALGLRLKLFLDGLVGG